MKKLFSLLTLALLTMSAWAATDVTITFSDFFNANTMLEDVSPIDAGNGVTVSFAKSTGSTAPQYYTNGTSARIYKNNTMTVAAASAITKIVFTYNSGAWTSTSPSAGAYSDGVWEGNTNSVTFTNDNSGTTQVRLMSMVVTVAGDEPVVTVAPPTFTPAGQDFLTESLDVALTAEDGATIYYNFDNGETWNTYSAPITLTATTTIYAKAEKDGVSSIVVHETYNKVDPATVVTFQKVTDLSTLANGDKVIIVSSGEAGSAYAMGACRGNNYGAVDVTINSNMVISTYDANIVTLEANGNLWNLKTNDGYLYAASSTQNQMKYEATPDENGNANAAITMVNDTTRIIFQGTNTRNHMRFNATNNPVLFSCYAENSSVQGPVYLYKATSEVPVTLAAPVFNPGSKTFTGTLEIALSCETEGAQIYYAIGDGEYQPYTGPFTINQTCTIKAKSALDGQESAEVTASYKKRAEVSTIAAANALDNKTDFVFYGSAVAVYQNGSNLWIKDNTGYGLIYGSQIPEIAVGATLKDSWEAQHYMFRGMIHEYQFPYFVEADPDEPIQTITATEYTRDALTTDNINERVIIKNMTLVEETNTEVENYDRYLYNIVDGDTLVVYKFNNVTYPAIEEGKTYDVEAMVSYYGGKVQLMPIAITEYVPEPDPELYIIGEVNGNTWSAANGVAMTYNAETGLFTAQVTAEAENYDAELGGNYSFFSFTTKLAEYADDWNAIAGYRWGADAIGSFLVLDEHLGTQLTLVQYSQIAFRVPSGNTYDITVDLENKYVIIDKVVTSLRGDVNNDKQVDINDVTLLIDAKLGKNVQYDAAAADCNVEGGDGSIDINDITALIARVLSGAWAD